MADAPRVFISYSHDSEDHADRVLALADALCDDGIDVILDWYVHPAPAEGWPRWMERNLDEAKFVLMVCTETYRRRALGLEEPGKGLGVDWEGNLIYNLIYHRINGDKPRGSRFIPILLPDSRAYAPLFQGLRTTFSCVFEGFLRELSSNYIINTNCDALYSPITYRKVATK